MTPPLPVEVPAPVRLPELQLGALPFLGICKRCHRPAQLSCGYCKVWRYCSESCRAAGCGAVALNSEASSHAASCSAARTARLAAAGRVPVYAHRHQCTGRPQPTGDTALCVRSFTIQLEHNGHGLRDLAPLLHKCGLLCCKGADFTLQQVAELAGTVCAAFSHRLQPVVRKRLHTHLMASLLEAGLTAESDAGACLQASCR